MAEILLVDDDEQERLFLKGILEELGHAVTEAADGRQALSKFSASQPKIVMTELVLPEMEGVELTVEIHSLAPTVPIIAFTETGRKIGFDILNFAKVHGASVTLSKPLTNDTVAEVLSSLDLQITPGSQVKTEHSSILDNL